MHKKKWQGSSEGVEEETQGLHLGYTVAGGAISGVQGYGDAND